MAKTAEPVNLIRLYKIKYPSPLATSESSMSEKDVLLFMFVWHFRKKYLTCAYHMPYINLIENFSRYRL